MAASLCPQCGSPRVPGSRFCGSCAFDFWKAAEGQLPAQQSQGGPAPTAPPPSTPAWPPQETRPSGNRRNWGRIALAALGIFIALGVIGNLTNREIGQASGLTITSPRDGATVQTDTVVVRGTAPPGAEIVHDISLAPDDHTNADNAGNWSMSVELDDGSNELVFRIGSDENTEQRVRVTYELADSAPSTAPSLPSAPSPEPPPVPAFADIILSGSGDSVPGFTIPEGAAAIAVITHAGGGNFAVISIAADGTHNDLLVNEIGNYSGTVLFDEHTGVHSVAFEITAGGAWTITIKPVTAARAWDGTSPVNGTGDDVVLVSPPIQGFATADVQHTGESNFAIVAYSPSGADLLVNEIGPYLGEVLLGGGTFLLEVTADGAWTVAPS